MFNLLRCVAVASLVLLTACTTMDYREDDPKKAPLPKVENQISVNEKWHREVGNGAGKKDINLQLVQDNNRLYTVDGSGDLYAVDARNGDIVWQLALRVPASAGPTVSESKLLVGTSNGKVLAVDIAQARVAWVSSTTSEVLAAPKIVDGVVFVHTMDGGLSTLSLLDGRQLWRFSHNLPPLMLRKSSTPVVYNDLVIIGLSNGKLLAMQKNDGTVAWTQEVAQPKGSNDLQRMVDISADPVVQDDTVYVASYQNNIEALTANNGHLLWEREIPSYSGFSIADELLYSSATNGDVVALDLKSGQTFWLQTELQGRRLTKPVPMGKYLVVADEDGFVHWLDRSTGRVVARKEIESDKIEAAPVVADNMLYVLGRKGNLVAFEVN